MPDQLADSVHIALTTCVFYWVRCESPPTVQVLATVETRQEVMKSRSQRFDRLPSETDFSLLCVTTCFGKTKSFYQFGATNNIQRASCGSQKHHWTLQIVNLDQKRRSYCRRFTGTAMTEN
jgi:hypothetical protein